MSAQPDLFADPLPALAAGVAVSGPLVAVAVPRPRRRHWTRVWAHDAPEATYAAIANAARSTYGPVAADAG